MSNNDINSVNGIINTFSELCKQKQSFIEVDHKKSNAFSKLTKQLYDNSKQFDKKYVRHTKIASKSLNELHINDFDDEQIWQQIQLLNQPFLKSMIKEVALIAVKRNDISLDIETSVKHANDVIDDNEHEGNDNIIDTNLNVKTKKKKVRIVLPKKSENTNNSFRDDMFFNLKEMENFLDSEDKREERIKSGVNENEGSDDSDNDDSIDYFKDSGSESDFSEDINNSQFDDTADKASNSRNAMYNAFFDSPNDETEDRENQSEEEYDDQSGDSELDTRDFDPNDAMGNDNDFQDFDNYNYDGIEQDSDNVSESSEFVDSNSKEKSEYEQNQEKLQQRIKILERENVSEKAWQLRGEVTGERRPENSVLEEHFTFDHVTRPAPLITEETTKKLEDIINQRIKDCSWDDVERKVKPTEQPFEYKRRITMEHEKSKASLATIYEQEFLKKQQNDKIEEENKEHSEIKKMMRNLFFKLDTLSSFNFTPRPSQPELKIINNLPAISAEEAMPASVSDATLLAPHEVFKASKSQLQNPEERDETDKKRARRLKKKRQTEKRKFTEKVQEKKKTDKTIESKSKSKQSNDKNDESFENLKYLKSSKKFFEKLDQQTVDDTLKKSNRKKIFNKTRLLNSKKLKL